jgi:hypothetical protein
MKSTDIIYSTEHYKEFRDSGNTNIFKNTIDSLIIGSVDGMTNTYIDLINSLPKEKKRLSILSLLGKDFSLFNKIKSYFEKGGDKIAHLKEIILMLRLYSLASDCER